MPFLLRIILQRVLIFVYSILAFLGIAPEANIPTKEEASVAIEDRIGQVSEVFNKVINTNNRLEETDSTTSRKTKTDIPTPEEIPSFIKIADQVTNVVENIKNVTISTEHIDDVLVNIICVSRQGNFVSVSNGSGTIVSPSGAVLTAAHVAQYILLEDNNSDINMDCTLYRENTPTFGYKTDIVYISPEWIEENHNLINSANPRGTGENDYAILHITKNSNPALKLPTYFPYIPFSTSEDEALINRLVLAAGYPGAPETILDIANARTLVKEITNVQDVMTFDTTSIDVFSTGKTHVGARGSSGGGVFGDRDKDIYKNPEELLGVIITTNGSNGNSNVNAITTSYINRDLIEDTGKGLSYYTDSNLSVKSANFRVNWGGYLTQLIESEY